MSPGRTDGWFRTYRTPLWLTMAFVALMLILAITPDPKHTSASTEPSAEPTPGPHECVVCEIDQRCEGKSGQCTFIDHTPLPCVKSAKFDDKAGFCLPEGVPEAPAAATPDGRVPRIPGSEFPGGIGGEPRQPSLPGFGN